MSEEELKVLYLEKKNLQQKKILKV